MVLGLSSWVTAAAMPLSESSPMRQTRAARADMAELVDALGLGPSGPGPWGFKSLYPHPVCSLNCGGVFYAAVLRCKRGLE